MRGLTNFSPSTWFWDSNCYAPWEGRGVVVGGGLELRRTRKGEDNWIVVSCGFVWQMHASNAMFLREQCDRCVCMSSISTKCAIRSVPRFCGLILQLLCSLGKKKLQLELLRIHKQNLTKWPWWLTVYTIARIHWLHTVSQSSCREWKDRRQKEGSE